MAKQADSALEAIRKKHLDIVGKEAGATLGVKQISAAIKKFQEENSIGDPAPAKEPEKAATSNETGANPSGDVDDVSKPAIPRDNIKAVANYPVNTGEAQGTDQFRDAAKNVTGLDLSEIKTPADFESPKHFVGNLIKLMAIDTDLSAKESLGAAKFLAKFNPYPEVEEAFKDLINDLEAKIKHDEELDQPLTNPKVNTSPITEADLQTEMVAIKHKDGRTKTITRVTWDKFLSKAPNGWALVPEIPSEIRNLK